MMRFQLRRVDYMPGNLEVGIVYFSDRFETAAHLCPCGCGTKVVTPIGPTEWSIRESRLSFSMRPSIGNWQLPCKSHYWIIDGEVRWSGEWSTQEIQAGKRAEEERHLAYYGELVPEKKTWLKRLWNFIKELFGRPQ